MIMIFSCRYMTRTLGKLCVLRHGSSRHTLTRACARANVFKIAHVANTYLTIQEAALTSRDRCDVTLGRSNDYEWYLVLVRCLDNILIQVKKLEYTYITSCKLASSHAPTALLRPRFKFKKMILCYRKLCVLYVLWYTYSW